MLTEAYNTILHHGWVGGLNGYFTPNIPDRIMKPLMNAFYRFYKGKGDLEAYNDAKNILESTHEKNESHDKGRTSIKVQCVPTEKAKQAVERLTIDLHKFEQLKEIEDRHNSEREKIIRS